MTDNKPKLLLINFSETDAEIVSKATGTNVYRGYISNGGIVAEDYSGKREALYDYYFPIPPYECSMVSASQRVRNDRERSGQVPGVR